MTTLLDKYKQAGVRTLQVTNNEATAVNPYDIVKDFDKWNEVQTTLVIKSMFPLPTFNIPNGDISIEEVEETCIHEDDMMWRHHFVLVIRQVKEEEPKADIPEYYPGIEYQELFDLMSAEHGLTLLKSQMDDIIHIAVKISKGTTLEP